MGGEELVAEAERVRATASAMLADRVTAEVVVALQTAGVPVLLLKGPSLRQWLYDADEVRGYVDTDLLVSQDRETHALGVLAKLGFDRQKAGVSEEELPPDHAQTLRRRLGRSWEYVDLHTTLPQALGARDRAFRVLSRGAESLRVQGVDVPVPCAAGRLLGVALHAAHDGRGAGKPLEDLRRALRRVDEKTWADATHLARELDVVPAMTAGLRLDPAGQVLAARLLVGVPVPLGLRLPSPGQSPLSHGFRRVVEERSWRRRLLLVLRELAPSPAFLRFWHRETSTLPAPALWRLYLRRWSYLGREALAYTRLVGASLRDTAVPSDRHDDRRND